MAGNLFEALRDLVMPKPVSDVQTYALQDYPQAQEVPMSGPMMPPSQAPAPMSFGMSSPAPATPSIQAESGQENVPSLFDKFNAMMSDPERNAQIVMALNSLRGTPDAGLAAAMQKRIESAQALKLSESKTKQAIQKLTEVGTKESLAAAQAIAAYPDSMPEIITAYYKNIIAPGDATPAEQRAFESLIQNFTPEEQERSRRIRAGLEPRAGSQFLLTTDEIMERAQAQTTGAERGKQTVETEGQAAKARKAREGWRLALSNLATKLEATSTGFFSGLLPAITSSQQAADQSIALMVPLLKDVFREAGEGVFTDADQKALTDMLPTRGSSPEVIRDAIEMIDKLVQIKLQDPLADLQAIRAGEPAQQQEQTQPSTPAQPPRPSGGIKIIDIERGEQ